MSLAESHSEEKPVTPVIEKKKDSESKKLREESRKSKEVKKDDKKEDKKRREKDRKQEEQRRLAEESIDAIVEIADLDEAVSRLQDKDAFKALYVQYPEPVYEAYEKIKGFARE